MKFVSPQSMPQSPEMRPRERLIALGPEALSPQELVTLVLGSGSPALSAAQLAERLLVDAGGVRRLAQRCVLELVQTDGVGIATATRLAAAFELARRALHELIPAGSEIRGGADVHRLLHPRMRDLRKERFVALLLDGRHRVLRTETISEGTLTSSIVHPREVFGPAIRSAAAALIVAHNHPSGDPSPSREDIEVTARLREVGEIVGIRLLDHVIVGDPDHVSLRELGYLTSKE